MNLTPFYPLAKPWLAAYRSLFPPSSNEWRFRILTFHDTPTSNRSSFNRFLQHVAQHHRIVSPSEVEAVIEGRHVEGLEYDDRKVRCLITFDDGYQSNATVAKEMLSDLGIKAIFFVCPSLVDLEQRDQAEAISRFMFEGKKSVSRGGALMTWDDLAALAEAGHTIGSHTLLHRRLPTLPPEEKRAEIVRSKEVLSKRLGRSIQWFAYPFGTIQSIDTQSYKIIAGTYRFCCSGIRGLNTPHTSRFALRRDSVELEAPFEYQMLSIYGGLDFLYKSAARRLQRFVDAQGR